MLHSDRTISRGTVGAVPYAFQKIGTVGWHERATAPSFHDGPYRRARLVRAAGFRQTSPDPGMTTFRWLIRRRRSRLWPWCVQNEAARTAAGRVSQRLWPGACIGSDAVACRGRSAVVLTPGACLAAEADPGCTGGGPGRAAVFSGRRPGPGAVRGGAQSMVNRMFSLGTRPRVGSTFRCTARLGRRD